MTTPRKQQLSRRTMFIGAGTVGAVAAVAPLLPDVHRDAVPPEAKAAPESREGYQLTEHVKRYYQTART